jgi:hypothetical protein
VDVGDGVFEVDKLSAEGVFVAGDGAYVGLARAGFRHVQEVQLHRAPTKRGAPTNEGPRAKADSIKGSSKKMGFNALGVGPIESGPA